ncbi:MAG: dihydroxy-acid dehydratase [Dehalococcoidales bacterium]|nr:dihydroxy-acid dehydratase [Dehalococcoidales bacterium]
MRSDAVTKGIERAPHRSLLYALGWSKKDSGKPLIGVVNSFTEIVPGHIHLRDISEAVKKGVTAGGGVPFEFNTIAVCDGIAMNHPGMKYSLPSRELIADSIEIMAEAHQFDGLVFIPNCDKIVPGMLMAAIRMNIPAIFVSGGPMLAGTRFIDGKAVKADLITVFESVGKVTTGAMTEEELLELEEVACPGCGSCAGMFTANTMNCATEAMGMGLPGNGTIPAVDGKRRDLARKAGERVLTLIKDNVRPLDIITADSLHNAVSVDMALGGSTNSVLHLMAVANEAKIDFDLARINEINQNTPHICKLSPAGDQRIEDLDRAGGIPAVMKELEKQMKKDSPTVSGKKVAEIIAEAEIMDREVIKPVSDPYSPTGGIAILFGNLAPNGAVVKKAAVAPEMMVHQGPARVFDSEEESMPAIMNRQIKPGEVVVIRYEGPKGGPGMREMLTPTSLLSGAGLDKEVALITDGRFSGGSRGAAIGHLSPEAAARGPIAALKDGDIIKIDINNFRLDVDLTEKEISDRLAALPEFESRIKTGYLSRYIQHVTSADTGAVFK